MNGILHVAFGENYDKLAAYCVAYSRRYTDLPFAILTNIVDSNRHGKWSEIDNVEFIYINDERENNRNYKTRMIEYTPFDKTLYLDCDSVIQKDGVEKVFDRIKDNSVLLNLYGHWKEGKHIPGLYSKALRLSGLSLPIVVYYGALCGFTKNGTSEFFNEWHRVWKVTGCGREMPALSCAAKLSGINVDAMSNKDRVFTWPVRSNFFIQHNYGKELLRRVGYPEFKHYKPFDRRKR